jgi:hypothetical protein
MLFQQSWRSSNIYWTLVAVQLIPNHLIWVEVGGLWRPGQIALTQPGSVLGHCPVEKQIIVPLTANQMGQRIAAECCDSHPG